jgi:hypothetical protein
VSDFLTRVEATRYVTALRVGGSSSPGLVEASDDRLYVVKFRGAGLGSCGLVAEVLVGELLRMSGLPVPQLARIAIDTRLGVAEPDREIQQLLAASVGENLAIEFLPGAQPYLASGDFQPAPELAAEIVWLDALLTNADRTVPNPNLLRWHERLWLIDHDWTLCPHDGGLTGGTRAKALARRPFPLSARHALLCQAGPIPEAGERLRARVGFARAIEEATRLVPDGWFEGGDPPAAYVEYLTARSEWGGFEQEAERARRALA